MVVGSTVRWEGEGDGVGPLVTLADHLWTHHRLTINDTLHDMLLSITHTIYHEPKPSSWIRQTWSKYPWTRLSTNWSSLILSLHGAVDLMKWSLQLFGESFYTNWVTSSLPFLTGEIRTPHAGHVTPKTPFEFQIHTLWCCEAIMGCGVSNNGVCMLLCVHLKSDILNEPPEKTINEYL